MPTETKSCCYLIATAKFNVLSWIELAEPQHNNLNVWITCDLLIRCRLGHTMLQYGQHGGEDSFNTNCPWWFLQFTTGVLNNKLWNSEQWHERAFKGLEKVKQSSPVKVAAHGIGSLEAAIHQLPVSGACHLNCSSVCLKTNEILQEPPSTTGIPLLF